MGKKIIAANWKMHKTLSEGLDFVILLSDYLEKNSWEKIEIILLPSFIHLASIHKLLAAYPQIILGAQHAHHEEAGAFTGCISTAMLASAGATCSLVGHSESRKYFGETNEVLSKQISSLLKYNLQAIFCCGESLTVRQKNQQYDFVKNQLIESLLLTFSKEELQQVVIAYEPIWAIGTGLIPTVADIERMQYEIRNLVAEHYDDDLASSLNILYGGSCSAKNVSDLIHIPGINGVLVGSACLHIQEFLDIIKISSAI